MNLRKEFVQFRGIFFPSIKNAIAYKFDFIIWSLSNPVWLSVVYFVWKSIYTFSGVEVIRGFTFLAFLNYMVLASFVGTVTFNGVDKRVREDIRRGTLVKHMVRPINYFKREFYGILGYRSFAFLVQSTPLLIFAYVFFGLETTPIYLVLFLMSLVLAMILNFLFIFVFGLLAFWFTKIGGFVQIRDGMSIIFKGHLLPIAFFPLMLKKISILMPFQYIVYEPVQIFLQAYPIAHVLKIMFIQSSWIVLLYLLLIYTWKKGYSRFSGVGV